MNTVLSWNPILTMIFARLQVESTIKFGSQVGRMPEIRCGGAGAMSDATLIARLGNEHTAGTALQQIAERQAMGMQASPSGQEHGLNGWADK